MLSGLADTGDTAVGFITPSQEKDCSHFTDQNGQWNFETLLVFDVDNDDSITDKPRSPIRSVQAPADVQYSSWFPSESESRTDSEGKRYFLNCVVLLPLTFGTLFYIV